MSYSMTYDSLLVDVRRYLERGFTQESDQIVYDQLPRLITMGERRIARELKIEGFIRAVTTPLSIGVSVYAKPDRWRDTVSMTVDGTPIFARAYEYIRNYWPDPAETGTPAYYADYDYQHWIIAPTPDTAQTLEILFYEQVRFLGPDFQTNWLTEYASACVTAPNKAAPTDPAPRLSIAPPAVVDPVPPCDTAIGYEIVKVSARTTSVPSQ